MSYELLLDDRALTDRAASLSSTHIVNSVSHCDSRTQAYLSQLLLDPDTYNNLKMQWIIRIYRNLDFHEHLILGEKNKDILNLRRW